ncbi:MAG: phosphotransferase [Candidatus Gracilibacteria bacterium]|nr:phosphotransferase [Candidatus Gracilibacteria bacterium]
MPETFGSEGYIMSRLENSGIESKSNSNGSDLLSKTINNGTKFLKNLPSSDYKYQAEIDNAINEVLTTFKNEETTLETNYQNSRNEIISQSQTSLSKLKNDVVNNGGNVANNVKISNITGNVTSNVITNDLNVKNDLNVANNLDESKIREAIYSACHIDANLENNNFLGQFTKGIIDSAIINNIELAKEVIKNPSILLDLAKQIFSYEGLKEIAKSLGKTIMDLGSGEPYKTGVALGELGIITTGTGAGLKIGKEALEVGLKDGVKIGVREGMEKNFEIDLQRFAEESIKPNLGSPVLSLGKSLYEVPKYKFLENYREFLGDIRENDILGEGDNAIILRHSKDDNYAIKISKTGKVDSVLQEFISQQKFYETLQNGRENGLVSDKIRIPSMKKGNGENYFLMERVEGHSLYGETLLDKYSAVLKSEDINYLKGLNDNEIKNLLTNKYGIKETQIQMMIEDYSVDTMVDLMRNTEKYGTFGNTGKTPLGGALDYLRNQGLSHGDLHPGNIMVDKNGNIYIIDFGKIYIKE